jgi:O-antigen/teichoic acid export membrane protein
MLMPKLRSESFLSNSAFIFLSKFFPALANLSILVIYSRNLPRAVYGAYSSYWIQFNFLTPIACLGLHVLVTTYKPDFVFEIYKKTGKYFLLLFLFWLGLVGVAFAAVQNVYKGVFLLIPFLFVVTSSVATVLESIVIISKKFLPLGLINILYSVCFFILHIFFLKDGVNLSALLLCLWVLVLVRCVAVATIIFRLKRNEGEASKNEEGQSIKQVKSLWFHLGFYDITQNLSGWVDKFAISEFLSDDMSAIYYNGTINIPFLPLLLNAAGTAALIDAAHFDGSDEKANMVNLLNKTGRLLSCIVYPLFCFLAVFRKELFCGLLSSKYEASAPIFLISILILPLRAYSFTTVFQKYHKGAIINTGSLGDLIIGCALMYPLYKIFGLPGVALSFIISSYLQLCFYLYHYAKLLHMKVHLFLPYINWIKKLLILLPVFLGVKYILDSILKTDINLIEIVIGGSVMVISMISLLFAERRSPVV